MYYRTRLLGLTAVVCLLSVGCGAEEDSGPVGATFGNGTATFATMGAPAFFCQAGSQQACSCSDGAAGVQICRDGGAGLSACLCGDDGATSTGAAGGAAPAPEVPPNMAEAPPAPANPPSDMMPDPLMPDPPADPIPAGDAVPDTPHCADVQDWDPSWAAWEEEVLVLVNMERAKGADCGGQQFGPAAPLTMSPSLRCSARLHSQDMGQQSYFSHTSQDGRQFNTRISQAGWRGTTMGENIAQGQGSPGVVVSGWMGSPGHCVNIMNGGFKEIGVGYYSEPGGGGFGVPPIYWTQNFGG